MKPQKPLFTRRSALVVKAEFLSAIKETGGLFTPAMYRAGANFVQGKQRVKELEELGLIECRIVKKRGTKDRRTYTLTSKGAKTLKLWKVCRALFEDSDFDLLKLEVIV